MSQTPTIGMRSNPLHSLDRIICLTASVIAFSCSTDRSKQCSTPHKATRSSPTVAAKHGALRDLGYAARDPTGRS